MKSYNRAVILTAANLLMVVPALAQSTAGSPSTVQKQHTDGGDSPDVRGAGSGYCETSIGHLTLPRRRRALHRLGRLLRGLRFGFRSILRGRRRILFRTGRARLRTGGT